MSVTFMPENNMQYCEEHDLVERETTECLCAQDGHAVPCCPYCDGSGTYTEERYPFEANLANRNAMDVLKMLGIKDDYCGSVNAQEMLDGIAFIRSLEASGCDPLVSDTVIQKKQRLTIVDCGRSQDQVGRYLDSLHKIAMEAARRKVKVVWG